MDCAGNGKRGCSVKTFHDGKVTLHAGDCLDVLKALPENSVDAVVTDPPYHLTSIVKRFSRNGYSNLEQPADKNLDGIMAGSFKRLAKGFMGKVWDGGDIAFTVELWAEVLRVLKPGGHMVCFGGTRTYHRMVCAIEDAGFEVRDQLAWVYGSGFPKSHNQGNGWGTALKPAWEPICLARKPLSESTVAANVLRWGTGALNIDGCRIHGEKGWPDSKQYNPGYLAGGEKSTGTYQDNSLNPSKELGRWPANLCHDGSPEVLAGFPETASGRLEPHHAPAREKDGLIYGKYNGLRNAAQPFGGDSGSAARFFYTAKADANDRLNSKHPTVKPVDLMQWLVRLVCPKGATVLDPFSGTGTTGEATFREGCKAILIEREAEYLADIERRMGMLLSGTDERARKLAIPDAHESLPLFALAGE
jgi:site-specific DNA-methyltransferase (adenine-specific)